MSPLVEKGGNRWAGCSLLRGWNHGRSGSHSWPAQLARNRRLSGTGGDTRRCAGPGLLRLYRCGRRRDYCDRIWSGDVRNTGRTRDSEAQVGNGLVHLSRRLIALLWQRLHGLHNDLLDACGDARIDLARADKALGMDAARRRGRREGIGQQIVARRSKRLDVGARVALALSVLFQRRVALRTERVCVSGRGGLENARDAKIDQLDLMGTR